MQTVFIWVGVFFVGRLPLKFGLKFWPNFWSPKRGRSKRGWTWKYANERKSAKTQVRERAQKSASVPKLQITRFETTWLHQGKKKHININKFAGLGGCQKFVYVFFCGHSLWGRKTHKQNSPKNPGTIPWTFCLRVLFFMCFFSLPKPAFGTPNSG